MKRDYTHEELARMWAITCGAVGTDAHVAAIMAECSVETLTAMLKIRGFNLD